MERQTFLFLSAIGESSPLLDKLFEVVRPFRIEIHLLARAGVNEPQGFGMQSLSRADFQAILHELFVFCGGVSSQDLHSPIPFVGEQSVSDVLHMDAYLVGSARLQPTLHERYVTEPFQHPVVGDRMFGVGVFPLREDREEHPVLRVAAQVARDGSLVLGEVAPNKRIVQTFGRLIEELFAQMGFGILVLGDDEQAGRVLVDTVYQS